MTVEKLSDYLKQHWPKVGEQLLCGTYKPQPVKRVEIPKRDGGMRILPNSFACIRTSHHDVICIIGCLFFGG